jgi:mRNA interferase RelE/StbE
VTTYRVLLERGAEKDLSRLSSEIHDRVIAAIRALAANPRPPGCRKLTASKSDWRIRVGDYRVIYEIAHQTREVRVNRVRHRREVYR